MWWEDALWGLWNGLTAWFVLIAHAFGAWERFPFYNTERAGQWYDFGFLIGAGVPFGGLFGGSTGRRR
jgi:hypothetical protein